MIIEIHGKVYFFKCKKCGCKFRATSDELCQAKRLEDDDYNALKEAKRLQKKYLDDLRDVQSQIKSWLSLIEEESVLAGKLGTSLDLTKVIERKNYQDYLNVLLKYKERLMQIEAENDHNFTEASLCHAMKEKLQ